MAAALKKATALRGTTASQVMDAQTLTKLNDAIADARNMKTVGGCETSQSDSALRQHARSMSKQLSGIRENTKALTSATTAVTDSKAAKTKQDATVRVCGMPSMPHRNCWMVARTRWPTMPRVWHWKTPSAPHRY